MRLIRSFDASEIRRPRFYGSLEPGGTYIEVCWDNRFSDPVWRLGVEFELPPWAQRLVDRWYEWRWKRRHPES